MSATALIITVPHVCVWPQEVDRNCDFRAQDFARYLFAALSERNQSQFDLYLIESDNPRLLCDNNRAKCRGTSFKRRLRKLLERYGSNVFVIDVHSFPNTYNWFQQESGREIQGVPDVVLLDIDAKQTDPESTAQPHTQHIATELRSKARVIAIAAEHMRNLEELGFMAENDTIVIEERAPLVYVFQGSASNEIMRNVRKGGGKAILIELRQTLSGPSLDSIIEAIANSIVGFIGPD